MIIAGEVSGDLHGAALITELRKIDPDIEIFGIGGDMMQAAGMKIIYHINRMAFLGFVEVVKHLPFIKKVQHDLLKLVSEKDIKSVVLIDYPGFNLGIAKKLKRLRVKIIYYISPQVWAWGPGRIKKIKYLVNQMLVVLPFEEEIFQNAGVNVEFVGHPLPERIANHNYLQHDELFEKFKLDVSKDILLILPGSRKHEVEKIFPACIKAAEKLAEKFNLQIITACSAGIDENIFRRISVNGNFIVIKGYTYDLMKFAKLGIVKSGTSTLEAGLLGLPIVIVYRTNYLTYLIGKSLVKLKSIGLVNIIAGERVVPELIQNSANSSSIYKECTKILSDIQLYNSIKKKLSCVKEKLNTERASLKAAQAVYAIINEA